MNTLSSPLVELDGRGIGSLKRDDVVMLGVEDDEERGAFVLLVVVLADTILELLRFMLSFVVFRLYDDFCSIVIGMVANWSAILGGKLHTFVF